MPSRVPPRRACGQHERISVGVTSSPAQTEHSELSGAQPAGLKLPRPRVSPGKLQLEVRRSPARCGELPDPGIFPGRHGNLWKCPQKKIKPCGAVWQSSLALGSLQTQRRVGELPVPPCPWGHHEVAPLTPVSPSPLIPVGSQPSAAFGHPRKLSETRASVPAPSRAKAKKKAHQKAAPNTACCSRAAGSPGGSAEAGDCADSHIWACARWPCSAQVYFTPARQLETPQNGLGKCSHASHCPPNLPRACHRGAGPSRGAVAVLCLQERVRKQGGGPLSARPTGTDLPAAGSPPPRLLLQPGRKRLFSGRARSRWPEEGGRGPPAAPREFSPCAVAAFPG